MLLLTVWEGIVVCLLGYHLVMVLFVGFSLEMWDGFGLYLIHGMVLDCHMNRGMVVGLSPEK